jgi:cyclic pyranopterin phosphate synthase
VNPDLPTLSDRQGRPLRDLRISVTDRCNFRCTYCMPVPATGHRYTFLPRREILSFEEIERLARICAELGTRKLRITGGEPLLRAQLPLLIERLVAIDGVEDVALTTNASLLGKYADALRAAGLGRITISLDTLDPEVFKQINGVGVSVERVLEGLEAAERAGFSQVKINCVVQRGVNDDQLVALARHFRGSGHILRFIEFMDVGTLNGWDPERVVPAAEILARISAEMPLEPVGANYRGEVAQRYVCRDGSGEIGIITSVTQPFCGDCSRARLSAEGSFVTCLFAAAGTDLKGPLRAGASDEELRALIRDVWSRRSDRYSEERAERIDRCDQPPDRSRIEMHRIGG